MKQTTCNTCCKPASGPWRVWQGDKIVLGCVDSFHDGELVTPSQTAAWHAKGKAIRTAAKRKGAK